MLPVYLRSSIIKRKNILFKVSSNSALCLIFLDDLLDWSLAEADVWWERRERPDVGDVVDVFEDGGREGRLAGVFVVPVGLSGVEDDRLERKERKSECDGFDWLDLLDWLDWLAGHGLNNLIVGVGDFDRSLLVVHLPLDVVEGREVQLGRGPVKSLPGFLCLMLSSEVLASVGEMCPDVGLDSRLSSIRINEESSSVSRQVNCLLLELNPDVSIGRSLLSFPHWIQSST